MERTLRYLFTMLWGAVPALVLLLCLRPARTRRLRRKGLSSPLPRETVLALFWMYCGAVAIIALTPRWVIYAFEDLFFGLPWNRRGRPFFSPGSVSLEFFKTFSYSSYVLAGNVVLFVPLGLLSALLWRGFRWWKSLLLGFGATLFIELWQLFIGRTFDVDDLMLNTFGVLCGFWAALALRKVFPKLAHLQVRDGP